MKRNFVKITFLGDILCSIPQSLHSKKEEDRYDYCECFCKIVDYLRESDYVCGNLETPIAGHELNYTNETTLFNTPIDFARAIKDAGINMVTTANNHCLDRGIDGLKRTIENLMEVGLEFTGTYQDEANQRFIIKDFDGLKVAFLSYTYGTDSEYRNNVLLQNENYYVNLCCKQRAFPITYKKNQIKEFLKLITPEVFKRLVRNSTYLDCGNIKTFYSEENKTNREKLLNDMEIAKKQAHIVVMCLHIGGQYNSKIGDYTKSISEFCINNGCDYVIGNHPHCVLNTSLKTNGRLIAYALGNFFFTPNWGYYVKGVYADYSIILSLKFDKMTHKILEIPFTISKTIRIGDHSYVQLTYDLYNKEKDKKKKHLLYNECSHVMSRFVGRKINKFSIQKEYDLMKFL